MPRQIPSGASANSGNNKRLPTSITPDFQLYHPCWRFGNFDIDSKWGLKSLLGKFRFSYTEELLNAVFNLNLERLNDVLTQLDGNEFETIEDFWSSLTICETDLPISILKHISNSLFRNAFFEKIYPKLKIFENNTWEEIRLYTHGKNNKSNNHNVSIQNLCKEARDRLDELGYSDRSEIYSLRLEGKIRIYGFKELNYLDIIWVDFNHEIYPTSS